MSQTAKTNPVREITQVGLVALARSHANIEAVRHVLRELDEVKMLADRAHQALSSTVLIQGRALEGELDYRVMQDQKFLIDAAYELASQNSKYAMLLTMLATVLSSAGIETGY